MGIFSEGLIEEPDLNKTLKEAQAMTVQSWGKQSKQRLGAGKGVIVVHHYVNYKPGSTGMHKCAENLGQVGWER